MDYKNYLKICLIGILLIGCTFQKENNFVWLEDGFRLPPEKYNPGAYWYWMNEHVSKEGITKDLEAMKRIGIGEAFIGNIYEGGRTYGDLRTLTPEWEDCMRFAFTEGERIGVKVGSFNCPGWSQAGGPWVKPEDAQRYLTYSEAYIDGNIETGNNLSLPGPNDLFQDVVVLAIPILEEDLLPNLSVLNDIKLDRKDKNDPATFIFSFPTPVLKRSLVITPDKIRAKMNFEVYARQGKDFMLLTTSYFDRSNDDLGYGPLPQAPICIALGETVAKEFKVVITGVPETFSIKRAELTTMAKIDHYMEKLNNKMPNEKTPNWFLYQWKTQAEPSSDAIVAPDKIINVSKYLQGDTLRWKAPAGRWKIMRIGMTPTMKKIKPAAPWAEGLEIDKMSRRTLQEHYDAYIGKITQGLPKNQTFHRVIADSYEAGPCNWTDDFEELIKETYGYDPLPWLAVISGQIVGSAELSDRFLWDLRRLVADRVASEFVGGMAELCEKHGTSFWLENYGWNGFPSEFLKYAKFSPAVAGEYWTNQPMVESRLAASACHIYGKNVVYAEAYTTHANTNYKLFPRTLKKKGDEAFVEGINHNIIHLVTHQPYEDKVPGINSWFGIELNRHNTWFDHSKAWIDYQRRACYMLQQGMPAADVCFFIGEDCPKMGGWKDPALSAGYDYDFINADVIMNDITVKNGKLILPSGVSYALLALPPLTTMRPELLAKIEQLVKEGANVLGTPVNKSPSLQGYPQCDENVRDIAARLWNGNDSSYINKYGQGNIFCNIPINKVLETIGTPEALHIDKGKPVLWKQRDLPDGRRIYFLTNQSDAAVDFNASFRVTGCVPEWWNPVTGEVRPLIEFNVENGCTVVPIHLDAAESGFVVFRVTKPKKYKTLKEKEFLTVPDKWEIDFFNRWTDEHYSVANTPLFDWTQSQDDKLKYFSGTATYKTSFNVERSIAKCSDIQISFENIGVLATVFVNGKEAGTVWAKPYRLNINKLLKEGTNNLEIRVTNVWRNKIVDKLNGIDPENRIFMLAYPSREGYGSTLEPSGIWGEVKITALE